MDGSWEIFDVEIWIFVVNVGVIQTLRLLSQACSAFVVSSVFAEAEAIGSTRNDSEVKRKQ